MKNLLLICALIFSITIMAQKEKVGEISDGKYVISNNLDLLKPAWDKLANQKVINYTIHSKTNENVEVYYLSANSEDNQIKISIVLELVNNVFYTINNAESDGISSTCTCSGCRTTGCDPRWLPASKVWVCINGCVTCKKTVTATVKPISKSISAN